MAVCCAVKERLKAALRGGAGPTAVLMGKVTVLVSLSQLKTGALPQATRAAIALLAMVCIPGSAVVRAFGLSGRGRMYGLALTTGAGVSINLLCAYCLLVLHALRAQSVIICLVCTVLLCEVVVRVGSWREN